MLTFELQCSRCFGATMADVLNAHLFAYKTSVSRQEYYKIKLWFRLHKPTCFYNSPTEEKK